MKIIDTTTSVINGPGVRLVVWFQGCLHACPGCFAKHTQSLKDGTEVTVEQLTQTVTKHLKSFPYEGLTLSGGDPLLQARELNRFLSSIKKLHPALNIYLWTGYTWKEIQNDKKKRECLKYIDTIITGRFQKYRLVTDKLYGSSNQEIWDRYDKRWKKRKN